MKCSILLKFFFAVVIVLCFSNTYTSKYKEEYENFISVAGKEVPGLPLISAFKLASEIPEFVDSTPTDKEQWNQLAKRMEEVTKTFADEHKKFEADPRVVNYRKTRDLSWEKEGLLEKEVEKIVEIDPRVQKIKTKMKALREKSKLATEKWRAFSKTKVEPLEKEQKGLIDKTYEKKYGSPEAWWHMTPAQTELIEAGVKKTKEYKKLEKQLEPLKKQKELLYEKMRAIDEEISPLYKNLRNIKNEVKQSKDFPEALKKLAEEIKQLKIQREKLHKDYRKFELEDANRLQPVTDEIVSLREKLFNMFKKMTEKK